MPKLLLPAATNLSGVELLISDGRLWNILDRVLEKHNITDPQFQVVTYIQPANDVVDEEYAVFRIVSPHPKPAFPDQRLEVLASMPLAAWNEAEETRRHYVGVGDPAEAIIEGLILQYREDYQNLQELI